MAYPDLYSDETIVLNAQNIKVKSVSFEAVLTTRRLILVDSKKHLISPQEILLATLRDIEAGENAIRDPTITLSIITNTGATRQMILTFSKTSGGGERKRECDEWVKALRYHISSALQHPIMPDAAYAPEQPAASEEAYQAPARMEVSGNPATHSPKKKIEIARPSPIKKIVETGPVLPKPVEVSTLPTGSFCNRCGNRVPPESVFCNKCGTPVVKDADFDGLAAEAPSASPVPQVQVPVSPLYSTVTDRKERPIEDVIHSIEPLIEDSVPRTVPSPLIPNMHPQPPVAETPAPAAATAETGTVSDVKWPVITPSASPSPADAGADGAFPAPQYPLPPAVSKRPPFLKMGVIAIVIIAIIAAIFIFANPLGGGAGTVTPEPTAVPTMEATAVPTATETRAAVTIAETATAAPAGTEELVIPSTGVWVHVQYPGQYTGSVGTPAQLTDVTGTGEKFFQIATSEGIVVASIQKSDGSSDKLIVGVYKNGEKVLEKSTVVPKGVVEIQADLKPATAEPTTVRTTATAVVTTTNETAAVNETANATATTITTTP
jgi:hypothetical protein